MTLKDIARPKEALVTAGRTASAGELATLMRDRTVGSVVITENDEAIGIVTDRDLLVLLDCVSETTLIGSPAVAFG